MKDENTDLNEYVSRVEFDNLRNQLANTLEIINEILRDHVNVDVNGLEKLSDLGNSIFEIKDNQLT